MLYHTYEFNRTMMRPMNVLAETLRSVCSNPLMPLSYTSLGRTLAAAGELIERSTRRYVKPAWGLLETLVDGKTVAVYEEKVLHTPFCSLVHFRRDTERTDHPRVLLVTPLSGHHSTMARDTVRAMLPDHDVYVTDWTDARDVPLSEGGFDLDDYIDYIWHFLRHLGEGMHVMAICQPAVPVLAAVALMHAVDVPYTPRSMVLMGGPLDTRINPTYGNSLAMQKPIQWFERAVIAHVPPPNAGFMRPVYPGFFQLSGFLFSNLDRHVDSHLGMFRNAIRGDGESAEAHRRFYDEYLAVMDLPAEYYLQTLRSVFQDQLLPKGEMLYRGETKIDPAAITTTALMTVEGSKDDIASPGQCFAAHDMCTGIPASRKTHHLQDGVGHFGLFNGHRWREEILPRVRDFIRTHDC